MTQNLNYSTVVTGGRLTYCTDTKSYTYDESLLQGYRKRWTGFDTAIT